MKLRVYLRGGLGNQLFQYAAGLYFAQKQGFTLEVRTDLLPKREDRIGGVSRWPMQLDSFSRSGEALSKANQPSSRTNLFAKVMQIQRALGDLVPKSMYALGIIASERAGMPNSANLKRVTVLNSYCISSVPAVHLGEDLKSQIKRVREPSLEYRNLRLQSEIEQPIILHVRSGDYLQLSNVYGSTDFNLITKTINQIKALSPAPVWLFTDSPESIDKEFVSNLEVVKIVGPDVISRPIEVLNLLSSGSHLVCANSTLSWWAAYLCGTRTQVWFPGRGNPTSSVFLDEMILGDWKMYDA